jgi:FkbM family methyltransferase
MFQKLNKLLGNLSDINYCRTLLRYGVAAGVEHTSVLYFLRNQISFVVDIGANRGQFAIIARTVFPMAKIISFEPLEEPAQIFKKVFSSDPNVTLHTCAIGQEKTTATIHVTREDDSSSLLPITRLQSSMFPGAIEKETRQVTVLPLSQALGTVSIPPDSLLKIDVQGFELDVLQGSEDILEKFSHLYIECSFIELYSGQALAHQIISWLEKRDFILSDIHNLYFGKNGRAVQGDFLFTHKMEDDRVSPL